MKKFCELPRPEPGDLLFAFRGTANGYMNPLVFYSTNDNDRGVADFSYTQASSEEMTPVIFLSAEADKRVVVAWGSNKKLVIVLLPNGLSGHIEAEYLWASD